jgi:hypothetical protein
MSSEPFSDGWPHDWIYDPYLADSWNGSFMAEHWYCRRCRAWTSSAIRTRDRTERCTIHAYLPIPGIAPIDNLPVPGGYNA